MIPLSIFSIDLSSGNLILLVSLLMFVAILMAKVGTKFGVPTMLLFLILGMLAGQDGLGIKIDKLGAAEFLGHLAMTIILLTGGLETSISETKPIFRKGVAISTLGVFLTIIVTGFFIFYVFGSRIGGAGTSILGCLLLAAVMSSTDSASVFSILRNSKLSLRENLGPLLELESGSNDPMAYVLTILLVQMLSTKQQGTLAHLSMLWTGFWTLLLQLAVGFAVGVGIGFASKVLLERVKLPGKQLYSILILSIGFLTNGLASILYGNGLLALYVCAIVISNRAKMPYKKETLSFFKGMTWLMQLLMFLMLGLLARPSEFGGIAVPAIIIGLFMMLVARPASVFFCLL